MRRPVREGHKPNGGRARAGEVGLCRIPVNRPKREDNFLRRPGREGRSWRRTSFDRHAPDSEQESACPRVWTVRVKQASVAGSLSRHSSFRRAVCVDAHVRICAGGAQQWASLPRQLIWSDRSSCAGRLSIEDRVSNSRSRYRRRLIKLIFAGRSRIIMIRRELPLTNVANPARPVAYFRRGFSFCACPGCG